jgi:hypothetical protein
VRVKSANKINVGRPTFSSGVVQGSYLLLTCYFTSLSLYDTLFIAGVNKVSIAAGIKNA